MRTFYTLLFVICGLIAFESQAKADVCNTGVNAGNIVSNCAFQTGDFTGWTLSGHDVPTKLNVLYGVEMTDPVYSQPPIAGSTYQAYFGDLTVNATALSQDLSTISGRSYTISFYLYQGTTPTSEYPNSFEASFGATTLIGPSEIPVEDYTEYTYIETASSSSTDLSFTLGNDLGFFLLDDVSVTPMISAPIPEPSTLLLAGTGLLGLMGLGLRRKRRA